MYRGRFAVTARESHLYFFVTMGYPFAESMSSVERAFTLSAHGGFASQHSSESLWGAFTNLLSQDKLHVHSPRPPSFVTYHTLPPSARAHANMLCCYTHARFIYSVPTRERANTARH